MKNLIISLVHIPNNPEEDDNKQLTCWINDRLISFDEGNHINYYIYHENEVSYNEDGTEKINTSAYQIHVEKPVTSEKIITAAVKDVYGLYSEADYVDFQAKLMREKDSEFSKEYNEFVRWVENGLKLAKGITTEEAREIMMQEITDYDSSMAVNSFILNDSYAWLDKNTRVGLMNSMSIEKATGLESTTLWLGTRSYTLPIEIAISLLYQIELYAKECYNKTAEHKANVEKLTIPEEILEYNYKEGYPEKLIITV